MRANASANGPGIAQERREIIFQPFVSSKPAAQGRGLGLYISRELAIYHDWQLFLDTEAGLHCPGRLNRFVLDGTALPVALPSPSTSSCIVIPKRDSADKPRIVYRRSFVPDLLGKLFALAEGSLSEEGIAQLNVLKQTRMQQQLHTKLRLDGQLDGESAFGILSSLQPPKTKGQVPWCQILVAHNVIEDQPEDLAVAEQ